MKWWGNWLTTFVSECTYLTINALDARTKAPLFYIHCYILGGFKRQIFIMEKDIKELIRTTENDLMNWTQKRDGLRNKIRFCSEHKFQEEVRIAQSELKHFEGIIYDFEQFIKDLKIVLKSYEKVSKKDEL